MRCLPILSARGSSMKRIIEFPRIKTSTTLLKTCGKETLNFKCQRCYCTSISIAITFIPPPPPPPTSASVVQDLRCFRVETGDINLVSISAVFLFFFLEATKQFFSSRKGLIYEPNFWTFGGAEGNNRIHVAAFNGLVVATCITGVCLGDTGHPIKTLGRVMAPDQRRRIPSIS